MKIKHRYNPNVRDPAECRENSAKFLSRAGKMFLLMADMIKCLPNIAFYAKDANGRIVYMNENNLEMTGWQKIEDVLGYTSEELYEPDLASVYSARDREVLESGEPIIKRMYGNVADRTNALNCVSIYPVEDAKGHRIGTVTTYYRADQKFGSSQWYKPIRNAITHLDQHLNENITVEELAKIANYSVAQFRKHFQSATQMSPSVYIQRARVNAAKTLLKTTNKQIADIAAETGFYDEAHLIRTFTKIAGTTPARFRRQARR